MSTDAATRRSAVPLVERDDLPAELTTPELGAARLELARGLAEHSLVIGDVILSSGKQASYYVDAKRTILRQPWFGALGRLVAAEAARVGATAIGGMTMGADPVATAGLAGVGELLAAGEAGSAGTRGETLADRAFFVRKESKAHGLQRRVEGPLLTDDDRLLVVEDVVTTGGSTIQALEALQAEGRTVVGVLTVLDRLVGGAAAIEEKAGVPLTALVTIDEIYAG
ncbi:MAG: phosphoribosyltransferase family protein [Solirubrobacteraceae bacterium]|nr:phosphoribosyltransferase family protein [Patulibacter sp.]